MYAAKTLLNLVRPTTAGLSELLTPKPQGDQSVTAPAQMAVTIVATAASMTYAQEYQRHPTVHSD